MGGHTIGLKSIGVAVNITTKATDGGRTDGEEVKPAPGYSRRGTVVCQNDKGGPQ
jgi:hypothetical protein